MATNVSAETVKKPILLSVDNSEATFRLLDFVQATFPRDHPLVVLHVQPHCPQAIAGGVGSADMSWQQDNAINDEMELESARFLHDQVAPRLEKAGFQVKTALIRNHTDASSSIGAAICKYAESISASMIVMTKISKSALVKFFTGSVTRHCVAHSSVPVLVC